MLFMGAFMVILGLGMIVFGYLVTVDLYRKKHNVNLGGVIFILAGAFLAYSGIFAWNFIGHQ